MKKQRLDDALIAAGLAGDREEAKRLVMAGLVLVAEQRQEKPGTLIARDQPLRVKAYRKKFASRAGHKLDQALQHWQIPVQGRVALDLGASTGGFTDSMLQRDVARVYAVDVGTNQLAFTLRQNPRVISLERTHARDLDRQLIPEPIDLLVVDVSFTSLRYVLPPVLPLLAAHADLICLFKPQFEVARDQLKAGGLVSDDDAVQEAKATFESWVKQQGLLIKACQPSSLPGRRGNQEFLYHLCRAGDQPSD